MWAAWGPARSSSCCRDGTQHDPLFLQIKEATASVLEAYLPKSRYRQHGERVVQGQRMMQAASDIYLGWTKGVDVQRNFYWRQLRDMKGSALVEAMTPVGLAFYADMCGWTLARAHARSGDPVAMAAYLGDSDAFDMSDHRLRGALRRPERRGLRAVHRGDQVRAARSTRGRLIPTEARAAGGGACGGCGRNASGRLAVGAPARNAAMASFMVGKIRLSGKRCFSS